LRLPRLPPDDGARDRGIDDPTNSWIVHPLGRLLLVPALRLGIGPNPVSIAGLASGAAAAAAFHRWTDPGFATLGFLLAVLWLVLDGLDGMIARATGGASDFGRLLDGLCDHIVFVLLYVSVATSIGTAGAWTLAVTAGAVHAVQASLFEGERLRYHRRIAADPGPAVRATSPHRLTRVYEAFAGLPERWAAPFDRQLRAAPSPAALAAAYRIAARGPLRLMALLTNNMRVLALYAACLAGDPRLFWWLELGPMTVVTIAGLLWHRRVERRLAAGR
jgi:CDP-diacylglycerol--serine O-phosphatidyltransferase